MKKAILWAASAIVGLAGAVVVYFAISITTGVLIGVAIGYGFLPPGFNNLVTGVAIFVASTIGGVSAGVAIGKRLQKWGTGHAS